MLRERLLQDGVGFAAIRVGPSGVGVQTVGVMRHGTAAPITSKTLFELGSTAKPFIALLLADGVLNRRWTFDDAAEEALPDGLKLRDANGEPLRLIDLATHRSGLPRMPGNLSPKELNNPYAGYDETRLFAFIRQWRPEVARGARFEYSNLGYGLLGQVLARREGRSLDALLADRIFGPLGLDSLHLRRPVPLPAAGGDDLGALSAALRASSAQASREATGHGAQRRPAARWQFDAMAGAVGLVGSAESTGRFMQAALGLFDHPLKDAFALCLQKRTDGEHPLRPFGLAWEMSPMVTAAGQRMLFNQDGATAGFSTSLWLEPARRQGAALLSNSFVETRSLALQALDPSIQAEDFGLMRLPAEQVRPLVGSFVADAGWALELTQRQGRLWARAARQPEFELLPSAPRRFFAREGLLEVVFDDAARPTRLMLLSDGREVPLFRQP